MAKSILVQSITQVKSSLYSVAQALTFQPWYTDGKNLHCGISQPHRVDGARALMRRPAGIVDRL